MEILNSGIFLKTFTHVIWLLKAGTHFENFVCCKFLIAFPRLNMFWVHKRNISLASTNGVGTQKKHLTERVLLSTKTHVN